MNPVVSRPPLRAFTTCTDSSAQYTSSQCALPASAAFPAGDPPAEYYKCHDGEQLYVWGNALRVGRLDHDGSGDTAFMQLLADHWAPFVRARDPRPEPWPGLPGYQGVLAFAQGG